MRERYALLLVVASAMLWAGTSKPAVACQDCFFNTQNIATCRPTFDGEIGNIECESVATDCVLSGPVCTVITVPGGGGSGGSGGGGGSCQGGSGGCPAECFSCSGGGGRPRI